MRWRLSACTHHTALPLAFALAVTPMALPAQPASPASAKSTDARLFARADTITVGDYCQVARMVVAAPAVIAALGNDARAVESNAAVLCTPALSPMPLRTVRGDQPASLAGVARLHADAYRQLSRNVFAAMESFRSLTRTDALRPVVRAALGDSANTALVRATETAHGLIVLETRNAALARLSNYERKLGPTSARLNAAEVLLNYGAQRFVPGFTPSVTRGPSPWEVVASYVPTYGTYANGKPQAVSASEFGLRHYLFGERFGASGWRGLLLPTYWSAGAVVVSDRNGALVWPWQDRQRTGAFVSWGSVKLGYVKGRHGQWLLSRQLQVIPLVF
jgi:hypothetical protein